MKHSWKIFEGDKILDIVGDMTEQEAWAIARRISDRPKKLRLVPILPKPTVDNNTTTNNETEDDDWDITHIAPFVMDIPDEIWKEAASA